MSSTIQMDGSGRLVLPKVVRERLNLTRGSSLRAEIVAGRIELTPVGSEGDSVVTRKGGIAVLARTGKKADAARAVTAVREEQGERGRRR